MEEIKVGWSHAIVVWWSLIWRWILFSMIAGFIGGFLLGILAAPLGIDGELELYGQLIGLLVSIPVGIWVVRRVLTMEYRRYRVALIPSREAMLERVVNKD